MQRLRQRADFLAAAAGPRVAGPAFVVQARDRQDEGPARVGFTVSKKVGTAVERNRVRRRLRAIVKDHIVKGHGLPLRPACDYVLVGRRAALSRNFDTMQGDLKAALSRLETQLSRRVARHSAG